MSNNIRCGFDELVEGYIEMLRYDYFGKKLAKVVLEELQATYELTEAEIRYAKMKCS